MVMWEQRHVTTAPASVILIRLLVGAVFLSEGIQQFLFPYQLGAGRFLKIGLPSPEILGGLVCSGPAPSRTARQRAGRGARTPIWCRVFWTAVTAN
jgi:uncharacterized membrane protein YphA (DoxX/SURF4 family)